ncbi:MAG: radical SAM family heme chaperone HemW [Clostridia bacterium]
MMENIRIYIHVPFCRSRCQYCDFNTYSDKDYLIDNYFTAMETEISLWREKLEGRAVKSVFFGGGTPSHVGERYIGRILKRFSFGADAEVTIEANPGTVDYGKLKAYREMGVNRISFGVQSFHNNLLKIMGRAHDRTTAILSIEEAKRAGFENISLDLIIGYPHQTMDMHKESLDIALELMPKHISCYSLKIEEKTPLWNMIQNKLLPEPDEELDRRMYHYTLEKLDKNSIFQYEISNFAVKGYESVHNIGYWVLDEYIGFGAGAHSYLGQSRFSNKASPGEYIRDLASYQKPLATTEAITEEESMREYVILGLRLNRGIDPDHFLRTYGKSLYDVYGNVIETSVREGFLAAGDHSIHLTTRGLDFANRVFVKF